MRRKQAVGLHCLERGVLDSPRACSIPPPIAGNSEHGLKVKKSANGADTKGSKPRMDAKKRIGENDPIFFNRRGDYYWAGATHSRSSTALGSTGHVSSDMLCRAGRGLDCPRWIPISVRTARRNRCNGVYSFSEFTSYNLSIVSTGNLQANFNFNVSA